MAIRDVIDQQLEAIWTGKVTAQQGLDEAVAEGNVLLKQFQQQVAH
jgi:sn-glycerol 3-phosphate transport system substrate-binding protein